MRILILFLLSLSFFFSPAAQNWEGTDKAVIEKFAEQAGRPAGAPLIDTSRGDLPLFCFLLAGAIGGFIAGYYFRVLFPPGRKRENN